MKHFAGQWLGEFTGTNQGLALLDLDQEQDWLQGMVFAFDSDHNLPSACAPITEAPEGNRLEFDVEPRALHPRQPRFINAKELKSEFPLKLSVQLSLDGDLLRGQWSTNLETNGTVELARSQADKPTSYIPEGDTISWKEFQSRVATEATEPYRFIFRGQSAPWKLRTSFHRTNRKDLWRFWNDDIPRVRHAITGTTGSFFDPNNAQHNGAFMHLLQHHGYPTPMLDWTYSPYIAAFFAYSSVRFQSADSDPVRIFMFDAEQWRHDFNQIAHVTLCRPHFSLIEPLALGNPRALPQQSVAAITNLDDVESYISLRETQSSKRYLRVFDLRREDRQTALKQLGMMGISPGSMFPGIEGVCREYRDRHFGQIF